MRLIHGIVRVCGGRFILGHIFIAGIVIGVVDLVGLRIARNVLEGVSKFIILFCSLQMCL